MVRNRCGLRAGDVVWAGAYPGILVRKKNSNRWVVEFFGFSNEVGSEKNENIVAFHVWDHVPCPQGEAYFYYRDAIKEAREYVIGTNETWGSLSRRSVPPKFVENFGLKRAVLARKTLQRAVPRVQAIRGPGRRVLAPAPTDRVLRPRNPRQ
ncbi:unnamed protein product [Caenorhabditis nigoni]